MIIYISIYGGKVPVHVAGKGKIPLVISGEGRLFDKNYMLSPCLHQHFRIYFVSLFVRGKGNLNYPSELSDFTREMHGIHQQLSIVDANISQGKAIYLFHSALSVLGYHWVQEYPLDIKKIMLVATSPIWSPKKLEVSQQFFKKNFPGREELFEKDQKELSQLTNPSFSQLYLSRRTQFFFDPFDSLLNKLWEGIELDEELIRTYLAVIEGYDFASVEPPANILIHIVQGIADSACPVTLWTDEYHDFLASHPNITLTILHKSIQREPGRVPASQEEKEITSLPEEHSAHFPMKEQAFKFSQVLIDFSQEQKESSSEMIQEVSFIR